MKLLLLCLLLAGCATAAPPTPRAVPDTAGVGSAPETVDTLSGTTSSGASDSHGLGVSRPPAPDAPLDVFAMIGGTATWYCGNGSPCTAGYGPADLVAAIDPSTGIGKGARLIVHHGNRHVTVQVVDVCACGGSRVIDLTSGAFSRLAPLSRGVIDVAIEVGDRTPVAAGRMTLPPTSTEDDPDD